MNYFEKSQAVKKEIEADSRLVSLIVNHVKGDSHLDSCLEVIGQGTMNIVYRVGQTGSGMWVALRENRVWGRRAERRTAAACVYNSYYLEAEKEPDAPAFFIGGVCEGQPFLLVEDVTEGGGYVLLWNPGGEKRIDLVRGDNIRMRAVDLGSDNPFEGLEDEETERRIVMGTFDINSLKYFSLGARLSL